MKNAHNSLTSEMRNGHAGRRSIFKWFWDDTPHDIRGSKLEEVAGGRGGQSHLKTDSVDLRRLPATFSVVEAGVDQRKERISCCS